jgi:hypothetical protein
MNVEEKILPMRKKGSRFYIITGSYTNHANGEKRAEKYSEWGYKTIINATNRDGTIMELVSVKTFSYLNQAKIFLKDFQKQADPDGYIFTGN